MEYSNHAPILLTLQTFTNMVSNVEEERISYKWIPEHKDAFLNDISRDSHILNRIISDGIDSNYEPDDIVSCFTQFLTDRTNPYFQKRHMPNKTPVFVNINSKEKQKWYNNECSQKRAKYQEALYNFNLNRTSENRKIMLDAKKDYNIFAESAS